MARGNWLFIHVLSSLLVIAPLVAGLVTKEWYVVMSMTNSFKLGLTTDCNEWGCEAISYQKLADYSAGVCDRQRSTVESRVVATKALLILSVVLAAIQTLYGLALWFTDGFRLITNIIHAVISFLSFLFAFIAIIVYGASLESWLFCDVTYCRFIEDEGQSCDNYVGYSYTAVCCGVVILFIAFLVLLVSMCLTSEHTSETTTMTMIEQRRAQRYVGEHSRQRGDLYFEESTASDKNKGKRAHDPYGSGSDGARYDAMGTDLDKGDEADGYCNANGSFVLYGRGEVGGSRRSSPRAASSSPKQYAAPAHSNQLPPTSTSTTAANKAPYGVDGTEGPPPLPEELHDGDWAYEADNGYFWSEERQMYFEPTTQQFYDPEANAWFDPETVEWVAAEEPEDALPQ